MSKFTIDTSGRVAGDVGGLAIWYEFDDLDDFTQGSALAVLGAFGEALTADGHTVIDVRFDRLSPETLARIVADCAHAQNVFQSLGFKTGVVEGVQFWRGRNDGLPTGVFGVAYPPLVPQLGNDGLIRLLEPA